MGKSVFARKCVHASLNYTPVKKNSNIFQQRKKQKRQINNNATVNKSSRRPTENEEEHFNFMHNFVARMRGMVVIVYCCCHFWYPLLFFLWGANISAICICKWEKILQLKLHCKTKTLKTFKYTHIYKHAYACLHIWNTTWFLRKIIKILNSYFLFML